MSAAALAFNGISRILFPPSYTPGFFIKQFLETARPRREEIDFETANPEDVLDNFWEINTFTDRHCTYVRDDKNEGSGGFAALTTLYPYKPGQATLNPSILIRTLDVKGNPRDPEAIDSSLTHETLHLRAMMGKVEAPEDYNNPKNDPLPDGADILFLNISNSALPIALDPRSALYLAPISEADACSKTAWLGSLQAEQNRKFLDMLKADALSVEDYIEIRRRSVSVQEAISEAAWVSTHRPSWGKGSDGTPWSYGDYYQLYTLKEYQRTLNEARGKMEFTNMRLKKNDRLEFVRIDLNDPRDVASVMKIGDSFGPNPFMQGLGREMVVNPPPLKPEIENALRQVEFDLGIIYENLRGYSEAKDVWGVTGKQIMGYSAGVEPAKPYPFMYNRNTFQGCTPEEVKADDDAFDAAQKKKKEPAARAAPVETVNFSGGNSQAQPIIVPAYA